MGERAPFSALGRRGRKASVLKLRGTCLLENHQEEKERPFKPQSGHVEGKPGLHIITIRAHENPKVLVTNTTPPKKRKIEDKPTGKQKKKEYKSEKKKEKKNQKKHKKQSPGVGGGGGGGGGVGGGGGGGGVEGGGGGGGGWGGEEGGGGGGVSRVALSHLLKLSKNDLPSLFLRMIALEKR